MNFYFVNRATIISIFLVFVYNWRNIFSILYKEVKCLQLV